MIVYVLVSLDLEAQRHTLASSSALNKVDDIIWNIPVREHGIELRIV